MQVPPGLTNVDGLLRSQAQLNPDKTALVDGDVAVSWGALDRRVEEIAGGLAQLGLVGGHRVAIVLANRAEFVACYLATLRAGLVAVPINPTSRPGELSRVWADCGPRVCFADESSIDAVRESVQTLTSTPVVVPVAVPARPGEISYDDLPPATVRSVSPRDPEALAVLLYTSGTSGRPRAAMLSHRALLANIGQSAGTEPAPVQPEDIVLGVLPLFHVYGLNAMLGQSLLTGATLVLGRRFDPTETLALIAREQITCVPIAPPVITAWLGHPRAAEQLSTVTMLISGAAPLAEETIRGFEAHTGVTVQQGYGLTEAGPVVTSTIGASRSKPGSAGRAIPGVELRVVDDRGVDVDPADPGEIWVRGRSVFSGYWPDGAGRPVDDGWLHTGDVGFLDGDGELFLVDRLTELVMVSGFNVYPSEIEDVVMEVPGVAECAVIGVADESTGEALVAFVVATPDAASDLESAVAAHCLDRLARFKVPARVARVEHLPRSVSGEVAKGRLRARESKHEIGLS